MPPTLIITAAGFAVLPMLSGSAWAQANRTFVSGHGLDTNPCTLPAPCRSFTQALSQTNAGGEITILDPAGYGSVDIMKSVSIVNDGVGEAGVTTSSPDSDPIDIEIGAGDVVNLRGLTLVGNGFALNGIVFKGQGALNIQNCVIRGVTNDGLYLGPNGPAQFNISDTVISNVNNGLILVAFGGGTVTAVLNRVQAIGATGIGFSINGSNSTGAVDVTIANSTLSNNGAGVLSQSSAAAINTQVMVAKTVVANNGTGVSEFGAGSATYLANNSIAGNTTAFSVTNSGTLNSFGDNDIKGNGNDGGTITLVATK